MYWFIFFSSVIAISCSAITSKTLVGYSNLSMLLKTLITIIITASWFSPIISIYIKRAYPNVPFVINFSQALYSLFGLAFIIFALLIGRDIFWYILYKWKPNLVPSPRDAVWLFRMNLAVVLFGFMVFSYSLYEGLREPRIKKVSLYTDKVEDTFKIALITDLHIDQQTRDSSLESIVSRVNALEPDVVLFAGDMVDGSVNVLGDKFDILKGLSPKYGVFFSSGNHELYSGIHSWINKISQMGEGFKFMDNKTFNIKGKNVVISAIPDLRIFRNLTAFMPDIDKLTENLSGKEYVILMSHAPNVADYIPNEKFDLQVSGHTHGGQIFPFHILTKMENKYLAGLYERNGMSIYVSRGTSYWGPPLRFLAPSEITLIELKANKAKN